MAITIGSEDAGPRFYLLAIRRKLTVAQRMTELTSPQPGQETRSAIEGIAAFAAAARPEQLAPDIRQLFKRNILDSIGCAIAALPGPPFRALRLPPSASNN